MTMVDKKIALLGMTALAGLLGCTKPAEEAKPGAAAPAAAPAPADDKGPIKVGILHSLSGTMAISETSLKDVALMTIEEINAAGGVLGRKLEPVVVDPASNWPLFAEKNLGAGGVVTFEGQYYHFDENDAFGRKHAYYVLGSWLTPNKIGFGKLQPLVRWQQATAQSVLGVTPPSWKMVDAYLTYVIDDYFLRVAAGYSHADVGAPQASNAIYLGVQMQR